MTALGVAGGLLQAVVIVGGAPLLLGLMRQVRARLDGRVGPGVLQPWRDLRKQLRKESITPRGTSEIFRVAPVLMVAMTVVVAVVVPFVTVDSPLPAVADLFVVVALLAHGTVITALAGLDTGTAFGGMGASREVTILALVEPTALVAIFALSVPVGSTGLPAIVGAGVADPDRMISPAGLLAAVALTLVVVAETGRLPVDNPATHLELTMVHEAMVLEYAGPRLALIELGAALRLAVYLGLVATLFVPWAIATSAGVGALALGVVAFAVKVGVLGAALAAAEVFLAKLRLFRVPELLAGSFLLALLAVTTAFVLG
ncbi:respiratory chain complex I subunit 1 family protein [Pseudonocardia zijingensis]|uniref:Respiratory chain complex I subunit 1 family protein n=1 Tax=Pseudonocardia zijingensis TaxID=153376 RepID=A0ABP3YMZ2_9PSEU